MSYSCLMIYIILTHVFLASPRLDEKVSDTVERITSEPHKSHFFFFFLLLFFFFSCQFPAGAPTPHWHMQSPKQVPVLKINLLYSFWEGRRIRFDSSQWTQQERLFPFFSTRQLDRWYQGGKTCTESFGQQGLILHIMSVCTLAQSTKTLSRKHWCTSAYLHAFLYLFCIRRIGVCFQRPSRETKLQLNYCFKPEKKACLCFCFDL